MKNRNSYPSYNDAINAYLTSDWNLFHRLRAQQDLSHKEKKLLEVREYFRKQQWKAALEILDAMKSENVEFFQAEQHFLKGSAFFYLSKIEEAALENYKALSLYKKIDDRRGVFISSYNLSVDFQRLGLQELSFHFLKTAQTLVETETETSMLYRALACHHSKQEEFPEAVEAIEIALAVIPS